MKKNAFILISEPRKKTLKNSSAVKREKWGERKEEDNAIVSDEKNIFNCHNHYIAALSAWNALYRTQSEAIKVQQAKSKVIIKLKDSLYSVLNPTSDDFFIDAMKTTGNKNKTPATQETIWFIWCMN